MAQSWAKGGTAKAHTSTAYAKGGSVRSESTEQAQSNADDLRSETNRASDVFQTPKMSPARDEASFEERFARRRMNEKTSEATGNPIPSDDEYKKAWRRGAASQIPSLKGKL